MPIELTAEQAQTIARLASEMGGRVSLHQIADGEDVYLAGVGEPNRYLIAVDGDAAPTQDE
jgi:hypothetical protein